MRSMVEGRPHDVSVVRPGSELRKAAKRQSAALRPRHIRDTGALGGTGY